MYNKVFLIGNLTRDPDLRYTPGGIPVVRFTIAVGRSRPKKSGTENSGKSGADDTDFINVVAWRRLAEICGEFLKKGRSVAVEGRLQVRTFEKNGVKRTIAEVIADNMQMLGRRKDNAVTTGTEKTSAGETLEINKEDVGASPQGEVPF